MLSPGRIFNHGGEGFGQAIVTEPELPVSTCEWTFHQELLTSLGSSKA